MASRRNKRLVREAAMKNQQLHSSATIQNTEVQEKDLLPEGEFPTAQEIKTAAISHLKPTKPAETKSLPNASIYHLPEKDKLNFKRLVNGTLAITEIKAITNDYADSLRRNMSSAYIVQWISNGEKPDLQRMTVVNDPSQSMDFSVTAGHSIDDDKINFIEKEFGFPISEYIETGVVSINSDLAKKLDLVDDINAAIVTALLGVKGVTPALMKDLVIPNKKIKHVLFEQFVPLLSRHLPKVFFEPEGNFAWITNYAKLLWRAINPTARFTDPVSDRNSLLEKVVSLKH